MCKFSFVVHNRTGNLSVANCNPRLHHVMVQVGLKQLKF